jgi:hypothetical protein
MSNLAEGFERGGDKEFIQFFRSTKGRVRKSAASYMLRWMKII